MIKSVGGKINGEEPAWVQEYNMQSEINRLKATVQKLRKKIKKLKE